MAAVGYSCRTEGAIALAAATAKSILGVKAHANSGLQLKSFMVAFDGVTSSAVPVLVEICYCTFATNSPGTNSTNIGENQPYGRVLAAGFTGAAGWTGGNEPTVVTAIAEFLLPADKGVIAYQWPLGQEPDCALAEGFVIRCTAPAVVNVRATLNVERI
jgi:hypothetical protein